MRRATIEALALSEKERIVLNVLRTLPLAQKISIIAKQSGFAHSTTSFVLKELEKRKLAQKVPHEGHFRWKYRKNLEIMEHINSTDSFKSSFLSVHSGMSDMAAQFRSFLRDRSSDRMYCIQGSGVSKSILRKMDLKLLQEFHSIQKKEKIIIEGVISESVFALFKKMSKEQLESHLARLTVVYVVPDELIDFPLDTFIFDDRILLADYEAERLVRITDSATSQVFKSLFLLAEAQGRKIDLNSYIRRLIEGKMSA